MIRPAAASAGKEVTCCIAAEIIIKRIPFKSASVFFEYVSRDMDFKVLFFLLIYR